MLRRPCLDCPALSMPGRSRCQPHEEARARARAAAHVARRRARPGNGAARRLRRAINARGWAVCYLCQGRFLAGQVQVDHPRPLFLGGTDTDGNVAPACLACHRAKSREELRHSPWR